jgi:hypothetical protein
MLQNILRMVFFPGGPAPLTPRGSLRSGLRMPGRMAFGRTQNVYENISLKNVQTKGEQDSSEASQQSLRMLQNIIRMVPKASRLCEGMREDILRKNVRTKEAWFSYLEPLSTYKDAHEGPSGGPRKKAYEAAIRH